MNPSRENGMVHERKKNIPLGTFNKLRGMESARRAAEVT